ncbi:MAG: ribonuclease [Solirubrobacteraceae bacterium]|jgi:ribonuclease Z|nr:ribonuclease [Solirubrobacteraceae bacterium]
MDLDVFFAGTAGSVPTARRGLPAVLVRRGGDRILFDCGEGTQRQLVRSAGLPDVSDVFLTHYHVDHWLGLPGMLKTFDLRDRDRPLHVHGPPGLHQLMKVLRPIYGRLGFPLEIVELQPGDSVGRDGYTVASFPVEHRVPAVGYALWEDERPGRFDAGLAEELGVRPGPDFGRLQAGQTVEGVTPDQVIGPARPGRKIVLSGDTAPCDAVRVAAHDSDLLVHESTFADDEAERAELTAHSTATQAATIAGEAGVRMLALTHVSTRYGGGEIRDEARAVFENTVVPRDFDAIELPLPERGEPHLVRWEG